MLELPIALIISDVKSPTLPSTTGAFTKIAIDAFTSGSSTEDTVIVTIWSTVISLTKETTSFSIFTISLEHTYVYALFAAFETVTFKTADVSLSIVVLSASIEIFTFSFAVRVMLAVALFVLSALAIAIISILRSTAISPTTLISPSALILIAEVSYCNV